MDYKKIDNVVLDDLNDYPDFANAYIVSADYDGQPMTEEEIEQLDSSFIYECIINQL